MSDKRVNALILALWAKQALLLFSLGLIFWPVDSVLSYSVWAGGLVFLLPNMYFVLYVSRVRGIRCPHHGLRLLYRFESGKCLLTLLGFALVFASAKMLSVAALFLTYVLMIITQLFWLGRWPQWAFAHAQGEKPGGFVNRHLSTKHLSTKH